MRKVKAVVYGVGEMGKIATKLMIEKGVEITGAIGNKSNIGEDLGDVIGLDHALNVKIRNDADSALSDSQADIVVMSVGSHMDDMHPHFKKCIENDKNLITIAEDLFYPWRIFPEISSDLDNLAKEHGVTLTAGGIQDIFWLNMLTILSGASHSIESVLGQATSNIDEYGPLATELVGVGLTEEQFKNKLKEKENNGYSFFGIALEAIIADLGLELNAWKEWFEPIVYNEDIECKSMEKIIEKSLVVGMKQITEIGTKQKILFRSEFITRILRKDETEDSNWFIKGTPDLYLSNINLPGPLATCAAMVNRIPDVIKSKPGLITVDKLPKPKFRYSSFTV